MKIYLDNNLGVTNVEQEELTQDTYGYNILKVYIPNAVLTPYNTFTCYYGALLQNGRKVGWFAMEARTSTDADYEANYTLYKATLEQCVVSVEGKVYIGCQVLLGNSGNATLIKKNTAVVQFNVRKSVAINNDILILDPDQTNTDVLESYKNLLENALTTYVTKASIADNLTTNDSSKVLSAKQGKVLKDTLDALDDSKADKADVYNKDEVDTKDLNLAGQIAGARVELNNRINTTNNILVETNAKVASLETDVDTLQNNTYSKTEVDEKIDDISAYTKSEIDTMINAKADKTTVEGINTRVGALETDIADLKSVQNVVDVVATKSALQSYDTTKLDANDKVQVIADETHDGASTIYNWSGSAWQYVGAFGGNSYTKAETYNKTQIDSALSDKADKSNTYTRAVIDSMILTLSTDKADKSDTYTKTEIDNTMQEVGQMFETVGNEVLKKANAEYISKGTTLTQTSYSNTNPVKSGKVKLYKLGGMSYKVNGTIQHSAVTQIRSKNGSTSVDSLSIPSYIRNIEGYGWGINNTCYNYIDYDRKVFVQKVGIYDLGMLIWAKSNDTNYFFSSNLPSDCIKTITTGVNPNAIISKYDYAQIISSNTNQGFCFSLTQIRIRDNTYSTAEAFKTAMSGVYLYYELDTPIETDISAYLTTDTIDVEPLGTIEFLNTYNQAVPNEVAYLFNAVTLNNVVDSDGESVNLVSVVANPTLSGDEATLEGAEIDGVKYKVGGGGATLDDIVDSQGNKRFIEGDGTPTTVSGITSTYCKWSLSGTHLMLVYAGNVLANTALYANLVLVSFELPEFINNKIFPTFGTNSIDIKKFIFYKSNGLPQEVSLSVLKTNNGIEIKNQATQQTISNTGGFRLQFDLLIDAS